MLLSLAAAAAGANPHGGSLLTNPTPSPPPQQGASVVACSPVASPSSRVVPRGAETGGLQLAARLGGGTFTSTWRLRLLLLWEVGGLAVQEAPCQSEGFKTTLARLSQVRTSPCSPVSLAPPCGEGTGLTSDLCVSAALVGGGIH